MPSGWKKTTRNGMTRFLRYMTAKHVKQNKELSVAVPYRFQPGDPAPLWLDKGEKTKNNQTESAAVSKQTNDKATSTTPRTLLYTIEQDCLAVAQEMTARRRSADGSHSPSTTTVALLNCANEYNCGGAFERIRGAQEEYLFRNTTLAASLWPRRRRDDQERWPPGDFLTNNETIGESNNSTTLERFYPLTKFGGIYSPTVHVFGIGDQPLTSPSLSSDETDHSTIFFPISVLTIAAQDLRGRPYCDPEFDLSVTTEKIRTCLHMAAVAQHSHLVLGAIGCGAFQNPPELMAQAFYEVLSSDEFRNVFTEVAFAIIYSKDNVKAFTRYFPLKE